DTKGVDMQQYRQDLGECREYANQVSTSGKVAKGAIGGAVVAGAVGAVVGNSDTAKRGAGAGAIAGAAKGYSRGEGEKRQVVKNCLRGRGYRVLN
ncbi:MAG: glycine zipper family protein, partial [Pseudomonadota bacterium]|nr:glycine zipper family protein [Pseudomonadota bacterium]